MKELVSVEWLNKNIEDKSLVLLDASLPTTAQAKESELQSKSIEGARYFDLKAHFSDEKSPFPNTVPSEEQFEKECQKLGINQDSKIVVFDNRGIYSSPRVWWLFKIMGHENVAVLNGGLPEWIKEGYPVIERKASTYGLGDFKATLKKEHVISYHKILNNIENEKFQVVDARSEGRFTGVEEEPRKHLKSGHIPNSLNIPFASVLDGGLYKPESELKELFFQNCPSNTDLVFSCGSGLTACIVMLASEMVYQKGKYVYDGSWTEWAELQNLKKVL